MLLRLNALRHRRVEQNVMSSANWVAAAEVLLAERNSGDVDIDSLCRRLGVTKGSFYWHFRGRSELISAILEDWRTRLTLDVNRRALGIGGSVQDALSYLLSRIRRPRSNRNSAVEAKVRQWAKTDPVARAAVLEVDQMRLMFFEELFRKANFSEKEAPARAYLAYVVMMGDSISKDISRCACGFHRGIRQRADGQPRTGSQSAPGDSSPC